MKDGFEGAFAGGLLSAEEAAFILFTEIGLDGFVVAIGDADELGREAVAKDRKFVQLGFERLSLARSIPFANDGLEWNVGAQRQIIGAGADLDGRSKGVVELLPAFIDGPVLGDVALCEVDEVKRPPFFNFERALKGEGVEKSELPIVVLRELFKHGAHTGLAIGFARNAGCSATGSTIEFQEFGDKELGTAAIDFEGVAL